MSHDFDQLNNVLNYLEDSHLGLIECAKQTKDVSLSICLTKKANERQHFVSELCALLDIEQDKGARGTVLGPLHRVYIDIKSAFSSHNKQAIKEEILRGDKVLIEKYNIAIKEISSEKIKKLLHKQLKEIHNDLVDVVCVVNQ